MSRGGWGGGRGRGGFAGGSNMPPMGLSFEDIQAMSRDQTALYPPLDPLPVLTEYSDDEKRVCQLQIGFATRMRSSPYFVVETSKTKELPRYSDKYRPSAATQPTLKRKDLHAPFFPPEVFEGYFNPKKKRKVNTNSNSTMLKKRMNIDDIAEDGDEDKSGDEQSDIGSQAAASDYDVDEEYDNDYAEQYFDNGENDDADDLGGGGGGDEGGGGGDYD